MSLDGQFTKDLAYLEGEDDSELQAGQGLTWPATPSLPNQTWPGAFKLSPFLGFLDAVCDVEADYTLEPEDVQEVAQKLRAYVQALGTHQDEDDIFYEGEDDKEGEALAYKWIRDLSILFSFAAQEKMYLYVYR